MLFAYVHSSLVTIENFLKLNLWEWCLSVKMFGWMKQALLAGKVNGIYPSTYRSLFFTNGQFKLVLSVWCVDAFIFNPKTDVNLFPWKSCFTLFAYTWYIILSYSTFMNHWCVFDWVKQACFIVTNFNGIALLSHLRLFFASWQNALVSIMQYIGKHRDLNFFFLW